MQHSLVFVALAGAALASPAAKRDACSEACSNAYNTCRIQPEANRAGCASDYATCLGYSPFDKEGSLVTPTACSITASATGYATGYPVATTSVKTEGYATTGYPVPTMSSKTEDHASSYPTAATSSKTDACATACSDAYDTCRGQPDANRAGCAADYAQCLGYSPFNSEGSLVTPTACSSATSATNYPTASSSAKTDGCATACSNAYNTCRGQPNANRASCAADYAGCLGYSPFDPQGSLVTPTVCSAKPSATAPVYTTEVVTALTTYCPASTTLVVNSKTYTVSSATTLTISDCPCTVTKTASASSYAVTTASTKATDSASMHGSVTAPPASTKTYSPCEQVYNSCVAAGSGSPNLAGCAASSASCAATATASTKATGSDSAPGTTKATGTGAVYPTTTKPGVVVTAGADSLKPVMGLIAVGAMMLI